MNKTPRSQASLAEEITKAASRLTYLTIRFLVDRGMAADAYRAYAYFRWVDDRLDGSLPEKADHAAFMNRQLALLQAASQGDSLPDLTKEELMLVELLAGVHGKDSRLLSYVHNMMAVMRFDAGRRGRTISRQELAEYECLLSTAVTDAMHHFIGHHCAPPQGSGRILAVRGAHVTHMLRDSLDDINNGYFNIPREFLEANHLNPRELESEGFRTWVRERVTLARGYFASGRDYLSRLESQRCRLAGLAYISRFERILDIIEADDFRLRTSYEMSGRPGFRPLREIPWLSALFTPGAAKESVRQLSNQ